MPIFIKENYHWFDQHLFKLYDLHAYLPFNCWDELILNYYNVSRTYDSVFVIRRKLYFIEKSPRPYPLKFRLKLFNIINDDTCKFCKDAIEKPRPRKTEGNRADDYIEAGDKKLLEFFKRNLIKICNKFKT